MKFILYKDGPGLCKTREGEALDEIVMLHFTGDGSEIRLGVSSNGNPERFYSITNGCSAIPKYAFFEGENKITVYGKTKLWKCESLFLKENYFTPMGCDSTEEILAFKSEYEKLHKRLSLCEAQLSELSKAIFGSKLFE